MVSTRRLLPNAARALAWAWLLFGAWAIRAQVPAFRRFDGKDGLPQSQVETFLEDRNGFLWVGTQGGVARMGSGGFRVFDLAAGLGAGRVEALLEDAQGGIWVAQTGTSLACIRGSRVEVFDDTRGLPVTDCYALALAADQQVLVATGKGLYCGGPGGFRQVRLGPAWDGQSLRAMALDRGGRLWIGARDGRVGIWDGSALTEDKPSYDGDPSPRLRKIRVDGQNQIWVMTQKRMWVRQGDGRWLPWSPPGLPQNPVFEDITIGVDGSAIVALGGNGLWIQSPEGPSLHYNEKDGLPEERIRTAFRDHRGILWIGTNGEGMYALPVQGLRALTRMGESPIGAALSMEEIPGRGIFLGTGRGIFQVQEPLGAVHRWSKADGMPGNEVWGLCRDGRSGLWVGTDRGMVHWEEGRVRALPAFKEDRVYQILPYLDGYLTATDRGIVRFAEDEKILERIDLSKYGLPQDVLILSKAGDRMLVGTGKGLWELRGDGLIPVFPDAPFARIEVVSVFRASSGNLWVGTPKGLYIQKAGGWEFLSAPKDLPDGYIYFLGDAGDGLVAVGHGKGVSLMDGAGRVYYLNQSLGMLSNETNQGAVFRDSKGRLWIGNSAGVNLLEDRDRLRLPGLPPPTVLEARYPDGATPHPEQVTLPARSEFVEFDFEAGLPVTTRAPLYEVMLEGFSGSWQRIGEIHQMRYPRLPGGSYRFRVRASLDGQQWIESPPVGLVIRRTWLEHPAGRTFLVLLGMAGVAALVRWRTLRLQRAAHELEAKVEDRTRSLDARNQELEQAHQQIHQVLESKLAFTRMVVHDLRAPVTTLALLLDQLSLELRERNQQAPTQLPLMGQETDRLESLLQRLLDQARSEALEQTLHLGSLPPATALAGLEEVLRLKADSLGIGFLMEQDPRLAQVQVEADPLALQQIVLNLVGNALKYTPSGGRVGLRSTLDEDAWVLEIWDTGRGMDPLAIERLFMPFTQTSVTDATQGWGLGLNIVKRLVDAHDAVMDVTSSPGEGTTFRIAFRIRT